jgi:hypothetical protein
MGRLLIVCGVTLMAGACATLGQLGTLVQAPQFTDAPDQPAEIRVVGPSLTRPLGGATVRLWATVTNPNPFGFTLATVRGGLFLQDGRAADLDLPLGLPLSAGATTTFPIDFAISFADLPGLTDAIRRAVNGQPLDYRFDGTVGVDAGQFGRPEFGPRTLLEGTVRGR